MKLKHTVLLIALSYGLTGCAMLGDIAQKFNPQKTVAAVTPPAAWQAPLPHGGSLKNLGEFWQRYPNPILLELINAAQTSAPSVADAAANIAQAQENRVRANAALLPTLDGTLSATRSLQQPRNMKFKSGRGFNFGNVPTETIQAGLQANWELDLYGSQRVVRDANVAQERSAQAAWHEARISVAAEVAASYFNYLLLYNKLAVQEQLLASSSQSAKLTEIAYRAGFKDAGEQALAIANLSDAKQQVQNLSAQCDLEIKNLVALTFLTEPEVREKMTLAIQNTPELDLNSLFIIEEIPANAIRQRPDVYRAEVDLIQAAANVQQAAADKLPKLSLAGNIGWMRSSSVQMESKGTTWSLGPIQLTMPIFDGGKLKAAQNTAEAKYLASAAQYRGTVQAAIKETENALVNLYSTGERQTQAKEGVTQLQTHLDLANTREKAGFASKLEVEESRRSLLQAQQNALSLQQERANAWLNLYRAAGGGWQQAAPTSTDNLEQAAPKEAAK